LTSVMIMKDPILSQEVMMDKSKCGTIKPSSACLHLIMVTKTMSLLLLSIQIFQLSSQLVKMTSSTFGTPSLTEMSNS